MLGILKFVGAVIAAVVLIGGAVFVYILTAPGLWAHEEHKKRKKEKK